MSVCVKGERARQKRGAQEKENGHVLTIHVENAGHEDGEEEDDTSGSTRDNFF